VQDIAWIDKVHHLSRLCATLISCLWS